MKKSNKELARAEVLDLIGLGLRLKLETNQMRLYEREACRIIGKWRNVKIKHTSNLTFIQ